MSFRKLKWLFTLPILLCCAVALTACQESIHDLARFGHAGDVQTMLNANPALLNARGNLDKTPLHEAATGPNDEVVKLLLDRGADIQSKDVTGLSPLHSAVIIGSKAAALELLRRGADIEAKDNFGDTPLHVAAIFDSREMLKLLVEHGAKLDAKNAKGLTPIQMARSNRKNEAAETLKALGASDAP